MHERFTGSELDCRVHGQSSAFSANGLFTAHITGNVVVLAAHIVARDPAILSYILSVPVFMLILFLTRLLAGGLERTGVSTLRPLPLQQLFFLIAFLGVCVVASPRRD